MRAVIFLSDGLGNQMFQYALYASLKNQGYNVKTNKRILEKNFQHNGYELERVFDIHTNSNILDFILMRCLRYLIVWKPNTPLGKQLIKLLRITLITDETIEEQIKAVNKYNIT